MKKLEVRICVGTTCYVMGSSHLQDLESYLTKELRDQVDIAGVACLDACRSGNYISAPFVKVGEKLISEATAASVVEEIKKQLGADNE